MKWRLNELTEPRDMEMDHDDEWYLISEKRSNADRKCLRKASSKQTSEKKRTRKKRKERKGKLAIGGIKSKSGCISYRLKHLDVPVKAAIVTGLKS